MKVIFRKDKETKEIIAFFPETYSNGFLDSYVHIGQHSIASIQYYKETGFLKGLSLNQALFHKIYLGG